MKALLSRIFSLRSLLWILAGLFTLYFVLVVSENWTGARSLAEAKAMLEREGETLNFQKLLPKPIPDAENFCAIEPLFGITTPQMEVGSLPSRKREALTSLGWLSHAIKHESKRPSLTLGGGFDLARPFNFKDAAAYLSEIKYVETPPNADATNVLAALDAKHPLLKQLSDDALTHHQAIFVPIFALDHEGPPFELPLVHHSASLEAVRALSLRSHISMAASDSETAVRSIQAALRLTQATTQEPSLVSMLVSVNELAITLHSVWGLLEQRAASDYQLARLQSDLDSIDLTQGTLMAVRGQLAYVAGTVDWHKLRAAMRGHAFAIEIIDGHQDTPLMARIIGPLLPDGWFDHNIATVIRLQADYIIKPLKSGSYVHLMEGMDDLHELIGQHRGFSHPHHILFVLATSAHGEVLRQIVYSEAVHRQSVIATALERHYLLHQKYPEALTELVPSLLKSVPLDPIDDQPMRYRQTLGGRYILWSIGADRQDDNGTPPPEGKSGRIHHAAYPADWVWGYTPVPNASR
ncbi:MAG TPA: hypothetical protein DDZ88_16910 [Verrucomicrobiales bacterium]|nr:hypothetical protein [Verrucomicrobiales bacterium]